MSGLGGGGIMLVYRAAERRAYAVDFGMVAPAGLDPADYSLTGAAAGDLFGWPAVVEDRNIHGASAIAVPGQVDGMRLALERFGSISWPAALAPAIELADKGLGIDWFTTLTIATAARDLMLYPASRDIYLPGGLPLTNETGTTWHQSLGALADTLRKLAEQGPRAFYEGEIARSVAADVQAAGGSLSTDDLGRYQARVVDPPRQAHNGAEMVLPPRLTAGPTLGHALKAIAARKAAVGAPRADDVVAVAQALFDAYETRLATMGDVDDSRSPACTTHVSTIDRDGNMVALTQTLLSRFGSRVVLPGAGILMNNGIMWFDPRPGRPNSMAPGKRPLSNMCPALALRNEQPWFAVGASGGRRIVSAVLQLVTMLVDHRMGPGAAAHHPRIDVSGGDTLTYDPRLDDATVTALTARFATCRGAHTVYPPLYACPNLVLHDADSGRNEGVADVMSPWSGVAAEVEN